MNEAIAQPVDLNVAPQEPTLQVVRPAFSLTAWALIAALTGCAVWALAQIVGRAPTSLLSMLLPMAAGGASCVGLIFE